MEKYVLGIIALTSLFSGALFAYSQTMPVDNNGMQQMPNRGGFSGPALGLSTVRHVLDAGMFSDDKPVTLTGHITSSLGGEMYLFSDQTGSINVEIDHEKWQGLQITPQTRVTLHGEIDKEFNSTKIDVDYIRLAE